MCTGFVIPLSVKNLPSRIDEFIRKDAEEQPYEDRDGEPIIDWNAPLDPTKDKEGNIAQIIEDLGIYYSGADRLSYISKELNVTKLIYNYYWVDLRQASVLGQSFPSRLFRGFNQSRPAI